MGMAASQARYLALVARKSNCEYEGQQINQARTVLSNQSANLFNQMLGLKVPVPPSTSDFTKNIYTYKDGLGAETKLESWEQLSSTDPDYNYVVTRSYTTRRYTGSIKKMNDPQVQFVGENQATLGQIEAASAKVQAANKDYQEALKTKETYDNLKNQLDRTKNQAASLSSYASNISGISSCIKNADNSYTLKFKDTSIADKDFLTYNGITDAAQKNSINQYINDMKEIGAYADDFDYENNLLFYFNSDGTFEATDVGELGETAIACSLAGDNANENLTIYNSKNAEDLITQYNQDIQNIEAQLNTINPDGKDLKQACDDALNAYNTALEEFNALNQPKYIGNLDLVPIAELSKEQLAELQQVVIDMKEQGIESKILDCFEYDEAGNITNYLGGVYTFKMNGITYYTSYEDLESSYNSGTGPNNIDGQTKLPYYNATYIDTKIEETEKALVETDGNGRFTSIRFEDDSIVYTLNMGTETDDVAYQDAMNQYYYDNAVYDKTIRDINAKTSIIQQEDQQLELRLKQLDTEQSALSTEMEAVKKVVDDNVESSFKTFGG